MAAAAVALACGGGCNPGGTRYAPVSGVVTIDGRPVESASVSFCLEAFADGSAPRGRVPVASGTTDAAGAFALRSLDADAELVDGAAVGRHRVAIYTELIDEAAGDYAAAKVLRKEILPAKYNLQSELAVTVPPEGTDQCNFELTTD